MYKYKNTLKDTIFNVNDLLNHLNHYKEIYLKNNKDNINFLNDIKHYLTELNNIKNYN